MGNSSDFVSSEVSQVSSASSLLAILQVSDSAFPTGGFVHSAGLEYLVRAGEIASEDELRDALGRFVVESLCGRELVFAANGWRGHRAQEGIRLRKISAIQRATCWTAASRRATGDRARALTRVAKAMGIADPLLAEAQGSFPVAFGAIGNALAISLEASVTAYAFQSLSGLIGVALRLSVVGPYASQRVLRQLSELLAANVKKACAATVLLPGGFAPEWEVASLRHAELTSPLMVT